MWNFYKCQKYNLDSKNINKCNILKNQGYSFSEQAIEDYSNILVVFISLQRNLFDMTRLYYRMIFVCRICIVCN